MFPALKPRRIRSRRMSAACAAFTPRVTYRILIFLPALLGPARRFAFARSGCTAYGCSRFLVNEPGSRGGIRCVHGVIEWAPPCAAKAVRLTAQLTAFRIATFANSGRRLLNAR